MIYSALRQCGARPGELCRATIADNLNQLLLANGVDPTHLDQVDHPGSAGCPTDGGTLCQKAKRADLTNPALWVPATVDQCGVTCGGRADELLFQPSLNSPPDPNEILQAGECYIWTIWARMLISLSRRSCLRMVRSCSVRMVTSRATPSTPRIAPFGSTIGVLMVSNERTVAPHGNG